MRDPEKTIGNIVDKAKTAYISYIDEKGNPTIRAMLAPRERDGIQVFKKRLWREGDTMYYSEGVTDPDYCVLKFSASYGRYYSNFSSQDIQITEE